LELRLRKTVVLVGMMGAGKTAIGTAVARELALPFLDSDAEIERAANMTIAEIFARDGEPFFREKETQVIRASSRPPRGILSTGGGAYLSERNRRIIHDTGSRSGSRPTSSFSGRGCATRTPGRSCARPTPTDAQGAHEARVPAYALAELHVEARPEYSIDEMAAQVIAALLTRPDVLERAGDDGHGQG
jgi:shikimate kinase